MTVGVRFVVEQLVNQWFISNFAPKIFDLDLFKKRDDHIRIHISVCDSQNLRIDFYWNIRGFQ